MRLEQRERPAFEEIRVRLALLVRRVQLVPRAQMVPEGPRVRPERVLLVQLGQPV